MPPAASEERSIVSSGSIGPSAAAILSVSNMRTYRLVVGGGRGEGRGGARVRVRGRVG